MPFTDAADTPEPTPTSVPSNPPTYSPPKNGEVAGVAVTVGVVGVIMFALITWLVLRLRGKPSSSTSEETGFSPSAKRGSSMTERLRPSFASASPSEASSRFGFIRKPLRLVHQREDGSWDFSDPDPIKEPLSPLSPSTAQKPRTNMKRSSTYKDEYGPRTPPTPGTPPLFESIEPPPPAYCRDGTSWPLYQPKDLP
ncbi:hypothetical protein F5I97DRAFT_247278 [Phlebopus sp. FC_14]|nr:hypothetical protein F5I97DRAFT_247278 [Phlebopus sp. FC_14]